MRAAMVFGRCFESALGAYFRGEDCGATLFTEWGAHRDAPFEYKKGETWDRFAHQGVHLLQRFAQDDRVRIHNPGKNLQIKILRSLPDGAEFVAYVDAIGEIDRTPCLIDWKTTSSRYSDEPCGLLSLDPQLICYSWIAYAGDPVLEGFHFGRATLRIWPDSGNNHKIKLNQDISILTGASVPAERLRELGTPRAVS